MVTQDTNCLFCAMPRDRLLVRNSLTAAFFDAFPVSPLHSLVIPIRHVSSIDELNDDEIKDLIHLARSVKNDLKKRDPSIEGFNLGINEGARAGQTIFHLHLHLIPRRPGDHPNPRGGVRAVIPSKAEYPD